MSIFTIFAFGSFMACQEKGEDSATEGDPVNGATVYSSSCASCHGADGTGATGPDLTTGLVSSKSDDELKSIVNDGVGGMPGGLVSSDSDLNDLIAYMRQEYE